MGTIKHRFDLTGLELTANQVSPFISALELPAILLASDAHSRCWTSVTQLAGHCIANVSLLAI